MTTTDVLQGVSFFAEFRAESAYRIIESLAELGLGHDNRVPWEGVKSIMHSTLTKHSSHALTNEIGIHFFSAYLP